MKAQLRVKAAFIRLGAISPPRLTECVRKIGEAMDAGLWLQSRGLYPSLRLRSRYAIFDLIASEVAEKRTLYLEFGVYKGDSIRHWSKLLKHPSAMLHGFDSFEGLPENWARGHAKGFFSTGGEVPQIADNRVKFFKGLFEETLPSYVPPPHEALVINMDADLYSSTRFVLGRLKDAVCVGTWLYFDEFSSWRHEFRAFREFVEETGMRFKAVAQADALWNIAFQRVA